MKKFIVFLLLCITQITSATSTTPTFSHPVLRSAYSAISFRIDKQIKGIVLDDATKNTIEQKKSDIADILLSIDASVKRKDKVAAVKQAKAFKEACKSLVAYIASVQTKKIVQVPASEVPASVTVESTPAEIVYYSDDLEGNGTANGNVFSQAFFSSAKCTTPLNSLIQVINGNKSVIVKNNDRPNCEKHPNLIDLTKTSFSTIGKLSTGKLAGSFIPLGSVPKNYTKRYLAKDTFGELGIALDSNLPNTYLQNDTLRISGVVTVDDIDSDTVLFLQSPSGKEISLSTKADGFQFNYLYPLEEVGTYTFIVAKGLGFKTSKFEQITVLDKKVFALKKLFPTTIEPLQKIDSLNIERQEFSDLKAIYRLRFLTNDLYTLTVTDGMKLLTYQGIGSIAFRSDAFAAFDPGKSVSVKITVQKTSTSFTHDAYTSPITVFEKTMTLAPGYKTENKAKSDGDTVSVEQRGESITVSGMDGRCKMKNEVVLTLPDGSTKKYPFESEKLSDGICLFEKTIPLSQKGVYLVEVNYDTGFAAYNGPVVNGEFLPILPNDYDGVDKNIDANASDIAIHSLAFINTVRAKSGKSSLSLNDTLNTLATIKAQDMATHNTLSHWDSHGDRISGTAKRNGIALVGSVGENVAGGNVGYNVLLVGLAYSGGHRENMLGDDWQKVGIGYAVKDGQVYYAQVFGE